jgi:hypothetical protein
MDADRPVMESTHYASSWAVSTDSANNTPSNSSRNSSFFILLCSYSSRPTEYTHKKIEKKMKQQSDRSIVVNNSNEHTSKCWNLFGFPALIESVGQQPKVIERFVMYRLCFTIYSFNSNSTRLLNNNHSCKRQLVLSLFPYQLA